MKYKVGDIVTIRTPRLDGQSGGYCNAMGQYKDVTGVITQLDWQGAYRVSNTGGYLWDERCFELVSSEDRVEQHKKEICEKIRYIEDKFKYRNQRRFAEEIPF